MPTVQFRRRNERDKRTPQQKLDEYVSFVIDNLTLGSLTTEQQTREIVILTVTALAFSPKTLAANSAS
jgi:hypothetical protein